MDLDLTREQSRELATTGRVAVWERIAFPGVFPEEAHKLEYCEQSRDGSWIFYSAPPETFPQSYRDSGGGLFAPHPPGTRAMLNTGTPTQAGGVTVRIGALVRLTAASCTPERRDEWGWLTVWEHEGSK